MDKELNLDKKLNKQATPKLADKAIYSTPQLKSYGSAVEITLGNTGGINDSGVSGKSHQ